jgi:hypothetical protein
MNAINWFEIPTVDMARALKFYNTILGAEMTSAEMMPGFSMAMFPHQEGVGGAIVHHEEYSPSQNGVVIYLNGGDDLAPILAKVEGAGGKVVLPKTSIGENGFMALFIDSEGNKVGLHSMN